MTPDVNPTATAAFVALHRLYALTGRATVREVAMAAGLPFTSTWEALCDLRDAGLVSWEPGKAGTLRPLYGVAA